MSNDEQVITKDDGGPAFPIPIAEVQGIGTHSGEWGGRMTGMSLRDYFAAQAVAGILSSPQLDRMKPASELASDCYRIADAMITKRAMGEGH